MRLSSVKPTGGYAGVVSLLPASAGGARPADEWQGILEGLGLDTRVWPIVAGICESRDVIHVAMTGDRVRIEADLFGFEQRVFKRAGKRRPWRESLYRVNGDLLLTRAGWQKAMPDVQRALDSLDIAYAQNASGLVCRLGRHAVETVYLGDACEYAMFDLDHSSPHSYGHCYARCGGKELAALRRLPSRRQLVLVEGWPVCKGCQSPIRPPGLRSRTASARAA